MSSKTKPVEDKVQRVVDYHMEHDGHRVALVLACGRVYTQLVMFGFPISVVKVPNQEVRYMRDMNLSLKKSARRMLRSGKEVGITKGARKLLRAALH